MPKRKPTPKITYPTRYIEEFPSVAIPYEDLESKSDPYYDLRGGTHPSWEEHLENIPISAFDHEPFQKALDTLEEHFNIMWDGEVHIQHGKRVRHKAPGDKGGSYKSTGPLYKSHSEFGHRPYSIFISGIMTDEDGRFYDVRFRYNINWDEDTPRSSGHWNPKYYATFTKEEKEKDRLSRWDIGNWTLAINGTQIPHRAIMSIIKGGKGGFSSWEEKDFEKESKRLGIKELDWN